MDEWIRQLCDALDVPIADVETDAVLDLARDAAHNVDRPAAPVTTTSSGTPQPNAAAVPRQSPTSCSWQPSLPGTGTRRPAIDEPTAPVSVLAVR